jgi:rubrerythrin
MPEFANPFIGKAPDRKLTAEELVRAIRLDLAAEEEAIHQYMAQADAAENTLASKVLTDIANEERQHAGEFLRLLQILTGDEDKWLADGAAEVNDLATEEESPEEEQTEASVAEAPSIGSMKE